MNNDFPTDVINRLTTNALERLKHHEDTLTNPTTSTQHTIDDSTSNFRYFKFDYIPNVTKKIERVLNSNIDQNIKFGIGGRNKIHRILHTRLKTDIPLNDKCNLVYKIDCQNCNMSYISQTKQKLSKRIAQHKYTIQKKTPGTTALSEHATNQQHHLDFDNTKVVCYEDNYKKRLIKESIAINCTDNSMNFVEDANVLHYTYKNIITRVHKR